MVIVADRGVVSEELLQALEAEGQDYIVGIPLRKWKASGEVLKRGGRYHKVADNLEVKEVEQDGNRYILCNNPEQQKRDGKQRASFVAQKVLDEGRAEINWRRDGKNQNVNILLASWATIHNLLYQQ